MASKQPSKVTKAISAVTTGVGIASGLLSSGNTGMHVNDQLSESYSSSQEAKVKQRDEKIKSSTNGSNKAKTSKG